MDDYNTITSALSESLDLVGSLSGELEKEDILKVSSGSFAGLKTKNDAIKQSLVDYQAIVTTNITTMQDVEKYFNNLTQLNK